MQTENYTTDQLKGIIIAAKDSIEAAAERLVEAQSDYDLAVGTGLDDDLFDLESRAETAAALHKRAIKRHAALAAQLVAAETQAKLDAGNAAKARADALLADVQQRINTAMQNAAAELVAAADDCSKMIEECNEGRRIAHINGVQYWTAGENINVPNSESVTLAIRRLGGLRLWRLY